MHTLVRVKNAYTVMTICLIALGAALLFAPQLGLRTLCVVYGVFLIVYGVTKLSGYFAKDLFQLAFQFDLALGIVSIVLGIIIIKKTEYIIEILSTAIGIFMLVDGAFKIQTAVEAKRFGIERWWLILVMSFVVAFVGRLQKVIAQAGVASRRKHPRGHRIPDERKRAGSDVRRTKRSHRAAAS